MARKNNQRKEDKIENRQVKAVVKKIRVLIAKSEKLGNWKLKGGE